MYPFERTRKQPLAFNGDKVVNSGGGLLGAMLLHLIPPLLSAGIALETSKAHDVYQFGVLLGRSMRRQRVVFPQARLFGFDTFTGLHVMAGQRMKEGLSECV